MSPKRFQALKTICKRANPPLPIKLDVRVHASAVVIIISFLMLIILPHFFSRILRYPTVFLLVLSRASSAQPLSHPALARALQKGPDLTAEVY